MRVALALIAGLAACAPVSEVQRLAPADAPAAPSRGRERATAATQCRGAIISRSFGPCTGLAATSAFQAAS